MRIPKEILLQKIAYYETACAAALGREDAVEQVYDRYVMWSVVQSMSWQYGLAPSEMAEMAFDHGFLSVAAILA